jgi:hypothetical protein
LNDWKQKEFYQCHVKYIGQCGGTDPLDGLVERDRCFLCGGLYVGHCCIAVYRFAASKAEESRWDYDCFIDVRNKIVRGPEQVG